MMYLLHYFDCSLSSYYKPPPENNQSNKQTTKNTKNPKKQTKETQQKQNHKTRTRCLRVFFNFGLMRTTMYIHPCLDYFPYSAFKYH